MQPLRKDEKLTSADMANVRPEETQETHQEERDIRTSREQEAMRETSETRGGPRLVNRESTEMPRPSGESMEEQGTTLFPSGELAEMRARWKEIQTGFVDEPRRTVEQADNLVASAIKKLSDRFTNERSRLEQQWERGDNVSTEDLRQALRQYRAFFDRLLSA